MLILVYNYTLDKVYSMIYNIDIIKIKTKIMTKTMFMWGLLLAGLAFTIYLSTQLTIPYLSELISFFWGGFVALAIDKLIKASRQ